MNVESITNKPMLMTVLRMWFQTGLEKKKITKLKAAFADRLRFLQSSRVNQFAVLSRF